MARYGLRARRIGEAAHPGPNLLTQTWRLMRDEAAQEALLPVLPEAARTTILQPAHAARKAAQVVLALAEQSAATPSIDVPRPILEQKWSDLNVPLIKAAATDVDSHPILEWLEAAGADSRPAEIAEYCNVRVAWTALRAQLRSWGIDSMASLANWLRAHGVLRSSGSTQLQYFGQRAQELVLAQADSADPRVMGLETGYVRATINLMKRPGLRREAADNIAMRRQVVPQPSQQPASEQDESQQEAQQTQEEVQRPDSREPRASAEWVPIHSLNDLEHCLGSRHTRRPYLPRHAAAEMTAAGVGAEPADHCERELQMRDLVEARVANPVEITEASSDPVSRLPVDGETLRLPSEPPRESWSQLDGVDLEHEFRQRRFVLRSCPRFLRGRFRHAQRIALESIDEAARIGNEDAERRAWKLFGLLSAMLLHKTRTAGYVEKRDLEERFNAFARGEWLMLLDSARLASSSAIQRPSAQAAVGQSRRQELAQSKIRLNEISKGRQALTQGAMAPGDASTLDQLRDEERRPQSLGADIPREVLDFVPPRPVDIPFKLYVKVLKSLPRGSSGGPGDTPNEHLKIVLDDEDTACLMHRAVLRLARAQAPRDIASAYMSTRMFALRKKDGGVRGIAAGTSFRRLVASCLARIVGKEVEAACAPFQYAMSTRAGTECIGHLFRAACDSDPTSCVLSIDGIGAFDHVRRAAMLGKLYSLPNAKAILPFVRVSYASPTRYVWRDDDGVDHDIVQGEGGEQGDPLMPLLFALGIHEALRDVSARLRPGEDLCAVLDDVYALCPPERVRPIYDMLAEAFRRHAGIELHAGKTKVWNKIGAEPPDIGDLGGQSAWSPDGLVILGAPVGSEAVVKAKAAERLQTEAELLQSVSGLPDPQCAWQLLTKCAVPRGNYWLRTLPPSLSGEYAQARDDALWEAVVKIMGGADLPEDVVTRSRRIAELPARLGGLGVRSSSRSRSACYWASWADALEMIRKRNPRIAQQILDTLETGTTEDNGCLHELGLAAADLNRAGFDSMPSWTDLAAGCRPPPPPPGTDERVPGWQFLASTSIENYARTSLLQSMTRSERACLRSQAGPGASLALSSAPTSRECTIEPELFQALLRRRLRWPLPLSDALCEGCGRMLDALGDHLGACMKSGRPKMRSTAVEATVAQICREAGARVRTNVRLADLNIAVSSRDERRLEVIASGLPAFGGAQLAIDATLRSPLSSAGLPRSQAHWRDGAVAEAARADKEDSYPELLRGSRCRLVVVALETGGRFSKETVEFLRQLSEAKAQSVPWFLQHSSRAAFERRWGTMLAVSAAASFIGSLLRSKDSVANSAAQVGHGPCLQDLLTESRFDTVDAVGAELVGPPPAA